MKNRLLCAAALLLSCTASNKEARPPAAAASAELGAHALVPPAPPARVEEVVETHAGITSRDPYRWMEAQGEDHRLDNGPLLYRVDGRDGRADASWSGQKTERADASVPPRL